MKTDKIEEVLSWPTPSTSIAARIRSDNEDRYVARTQLDALKEESKKMREEIKKEITFLRSDAVRSSIAVLNRLQALEAALVGVQ